MRVECSIAQFVELGLVILTRSENDFDWNIGPTED